MNAMTAAPGNCSFEGDSEADRAQDRFDMCVELNQILPFKVNLWFTWFTRDTNGLQE